MREPQLPEMARTPTNKAEQVLLSELRERLKNLRGLLPTLTRPAANKAMIELLALMSEIEEARSHLDPIKEPGASFDPTNPDTAGRLVALALIAQDKVPMARTIRTYGSGVYAIYYAGDHPAYAGVSRTETPIYVGKADPQNAEARTSREQGPQLFGRLDDHRRMIKTVGTYATTNNLPNPLRVEDFHCRRLVCATNAQLVAERHLITTFKPIWNSEIGICWGISKHGDSAKTRANKRSPWDVMHPGRAWALAESLADKSTPAEITKGITAHLKANPPYRDRDSLIQHFLNAFIQHAPLTDRSIDIETESSSSG
jgi:hypothetical protein